jgi:hypothetical protein
MPLRVAALFWPLGVAGYFRQKPFRQAFLSPETVPTGFRHLPAGRRFALHP